MPAATVCPKCQKGVPLSGAFDDVVICPHCHVGFPVEPSKTMAEGDDAAATMVSETTDQTLVTDHQSDLHDRPAAQRNGPRYQAMDELGRGGMGVILKAKDHGLNREVAMKVLLRDGQDHRLRFQEEAQITGQLEHPNIPPVHELGTAKDGKPFFTMKLVRGESLKGIFKRRRDSRHFARDWPLQRLLRTLVAVCDAIAFAHDRGVIHRDIKADNVMVGAYGEVQVMDWGLAKYIGAPTQSRPRRSRSSDRLKSQQDRQSLRVPSSHDVPIITSTRSSVDSNLTMDGNVVGTPTTMAPEQARGENDHIDHRCDIYSLGVLLFEILTQRPPFLPGKPKAVLKKVINGHFPDPSTVAGDDPVPKELEAICLRAMALSRSKRYQHCLELRDDLLAWLDGRAVSVVEDNLMRVAIRTCKRNKAATAVTGIAALVLLALAAFAYSNISAAKDQAEAERAEAVTALERAEAAEQARAEDRAAAVPVLLQAADEELIAGDLERARTYLLMAHDYAPDQLQVTEMLGFLALADQDPRTARDWLGHHPRVGPARQIADLAVETPLPADRIARLLTEIGHHQLAGLVFADADARKQQFIERIRDRWPEQVQIGTDDGLIVRIHTPDVTDADMALFANSPVTSLSIHRAQNIQDFSPLAHTRLRSLMITGARHLSDLAAIVQPQLKDLHIHAAPSLQDVTPLQQATRLHRLWLFDCPRIYDLDPLGPLPLKDLAINGLRPGVAVDRLRRHPFERLHIAGKDGRETQRLLEKLADRPLPEVVIHPGSGALKLPPNGRYEHLSVRHYYGTTPPDLVGHGIRHLQWNLHRNLNTLAWVAELDLHSLRVEGLDADSDCDVLATLEIDTLILGPQDMPLVAALVRANPHIRHLAVARRWAQPDPVPADEFWAQYDAEGAGR